jgi:hypothetical protein
MLRAGICRRHSPFSWLPLLMGAALCANLVTLHAIGSQRSTDHVAHLATGTPLTIKACILSLEVDVTDGQCLLIETLVGIIDHWFARIDG